MKSFSFKVISWALKVTLLPRIENVQDYDGHHGPEANAKESVKCKARSWDISSKIISC